MSLVNTGLLYPEISGSAGGGFIVSNIGVSTLFTVSPTVPLSIVPSPGTAVLLTGLAASASGAVSVTVEGLSSTGVVINNKPLGGSVGSVIISRGFSSTSETIGQASIDSILFGQDEEVLMVTSIQKSILYTYNEVILL